MRALFLLAIILLAVLAVLVLGAKAAHGQAATAQRFLDAPFSQLTSNVPDGSVRHCINCQQTNPCTVSLTGQQATAQRLNGVWDCSASGTVTGVSSVTGTANQIITNGASGNITLSAPQDIAANSNVQFLGLRVGGISSGFLRFDESSAPSTSTGGTSHIYMDSTSHRLKVSQNGGSYGLLAFTGTIPQNFLAKSDVNGQLVTAAVSENGSFFTSSLPILSSTYQFGTGSKITSSTDGRITLSNAAGTGFTSLYFKSATGPNITLDAVGGGVFNFQANSGGGGALVQAGGFETTFQVGEGFTARNPYGAVTVTASDNFFIPYTPWSLKLPVDDGSTGMFLRNSSGTGDTEWAKVDLTSTTNVDGTLPVTSGGTGLTTITSNALIKGNGSSAITVTGITVDSSNNTSSGGNLKLGVASSVAGNLALEAGSATSVVANNVQIQAPSSITGWNQLLPTAAGDGVLFNTNASNVVTQTFVNAETLLATTASVNLNTATAQTLYTCPTGKTCVVTRVVIRAASTSLTTVSFSIGWNSASFNNVVANATHTELTGATLYTILSAKAGATVGASTEILKLLNNTLQGGAATCTVDVIGWWF